MTVASHTGHFAVARRGHARIADADVITACERLHGGGLLDLLEPLVARDTGRPRLLTLEGLLTGMQLCADRHDGAVLLDRTTDLLQYRISPGMRTRFRIPERPETDRGFEAAYACARRLFHTLLDALDPSPLPKNRQLDRAEADRIALAAGTRDLAERATRLQKAVGLLIEDSLTPARHLLDERWDGSIALDATPVRTFARGTRTTGPVTATDPDAGWYVREGDHRDPDDATAPANPHAKNSGSKQSKKPSRRAKYLFGYDATLAIARNPGRDGSPTPQGHADPGQLPALVVGFTLDKPGHRPGPNAVNVLADVRVRGHRPGYLAGDRAYNNTAPDAFQLPARALGYRMVFDYRTDQLGIQAGHAGALMIEGTWYCPAIPQPLIDTTADLHAKRIDGETWTRRIAARVPFRLMPKQHPDAEGHQRFMCPASAGKLQCPIKPRSLGTRPHLPLADPEPTPAGPLTVCRQHSITIDPEAGAQHRQDLDYGGEDWQRVYFRLRNSVEAFNSYAKDPAYEAIEQAGRRRIRGIAAQTLLLAFQLAHANQRKLTRWVDTLPAVGARPRRRPTRRRPTKPLGTWTPTGHLTPV
ncbi:hypothetical protein ACIG3E_05500 [Streptomyces sp. NPDC053474]|uniref:hypothetical protein n=1 Tax=Streptomyces sp. NPDC053474 TaxID=3365704 RepID=UPI0037D6117E